MTDVDQLIREFRADQPGPEAAPAAVVEAARAARGPRRRQLRRRVLAGAGVTATVAGAAALLFVALPGGDDRTADVPGDSAAVATIRVTAFGEVTDSLMARVGAIIRARAAAQRLAGVEVTRDGPDRLTLVVPRSAGWERVRLLTADPDVRIVDITEIDDASTAPVVVPPDAITEITLPGDLLRVGIADRTAGDLPNLLARGRRLALVGERDGSEQVVGIVDPVSETMSSQALLVRPKDTARGAPERWAQTLAGGGTDADIDVQEVRTRGVPPDGVADVPQRVLELLDLGLGEPPIVPGTIRPLIDGVLQGRRVIEWQGTDAAGRLRGALSIEGDSLSSGGCGSEPAPEVPLFACFWGSGMETAYVGGVADPEIARIELRRDGVAYGVLRAGPRFVGVLPMGRGGRVTMLGLDAGGGTVAQAEVAFPVPGTRPVPAP